MDLDLFLFTKGATFEFAQNRYFFSAFYSEFHFPFPANKPNNCRQDKTSPSYDLFSLNSQPGTRPRIGGKGEKQSASEGSREVVWGGKSVAPI